MTLPRGKVTVVPVEVHHRHHFEPAVEEGRFHCSLLLDTELLVVVLGLGHLLHPDTNLGAALHRIVALTESDTAFPCLQLHDTCRGEAGSGRTQLEHHCTACLEGCTSAVHPGARTVVGTDGVAVAELGSSSLVGWEQVVVPTVPVFALAAAL